MLKNIIVAGFHRNAELAERNLARLIRIHKAEGGQIVARRNDRGKFSERGRHFTFVLTTRTKRKKKRTPTPPPKGRLFRLTIGITYPGHGSKIHRDDYMGYSLQHWQGSKSFPMKRRNELIELTTQGLEKHLGYPREKFWFDLPSAIGIEPPSPNFENPSFKGRYELTADEEGEGTGTFGSLEELRDFVEEDQ